MDVSQRFIEGLVDGCEREADFAAMTFAYASWIPSAARGSR